MLPNRRRAKRPAPSGLDYEQTIIPGHIYQSWLQNSSEVRSRRRRKRKVCIYLLLQILNLSYSESVGVQLLVLINWFYHFKYLRKGGTFSNCPNARLLSEIKPSSMIIHFLQHLDFMSRMKTSTLMELPPLVLIEKLFSNGTGEVHFPAPLMQLWMRSTQPPHDSPSG